MNTPRPRSAARRGFFEDALAMTRRSKGTARSDRGAILDGLAQEHRIWDRQALAAVVDDVESIRSAGQGAKDVDERPDTLDRLADALSETHALAIDDRNFERLLVACGNDSGRLDTLLGALEDLRNLSSRAHRAPRRGGAGTATWLPAAVDRLALYWRGPLGRPFTVGFIEDPDLKPVSRAAQFVVAILREIDPGVTASACRSVMQRGRTSVR